MANETALRILREQRDKAAKDLETAKREMTRTRADADAAEDLVAIYQDTVDELDDSIAILTPTAAPDEEPPGQPA